MACETAPSGRDYREQVQESVRVVTGTWLTFSDMAGQDELRSLAVVLVWLVILGPSNCHVTVIWAPRGFAQRMAQLRIGRPTLALS